MLEGKGRFWKTDSKIYVYIPSQVVTDSTFPLKGKKGDVKVRIENNSLIITLEKKE